MLRNSNRLARENDLRFFLFSVKNIDRFYLRKRLRHDPFCPAEWCFYHDKLLFLFHICDFTQSIVIEILYLLSKTRTFVRADVVDENMERIIAYVNEHYTEPITLELLSEIGYLSVYHLCRQFRKITGLTVHQYITKKRLSLVRELVNTQSIGDAANLAGFSSYTSFYRAYKQEYGVPPKYELKK